MTLGRCPLSIFCSRGTPPREVARVCGPESIIHANRSPNCATRPCDRFREGCRESRRCSRDTYPESYITKCTSKRRQIGRQTRPLQLNFGVRAVLSFCVWRPAGAPYFLFCVWRPPCKQDSENDLGKSTSESGRFLNLVFCALPGET